MLLGTAVLFTWGCVGPAVERRKGSERVALPEEDKRFWGIHACLI
jgi:hypothetical protein